MSETLRLLLDDESGATAIEYGLTCSLLAIVLIVALQTLGNKISSDFSTIAANL